MDKATVVGIILAWVALIGSTAMEGGEASGFFKLAPAILVFGGTFGATLAGFSLKQIRELPAKIKAAFVSNQPDHEEMLRVILSLAVRARREGILGLEQDVEKLKDPFMKNGLQLAIDGLDTDSIRSIMEEEQHRMRTWYKEGEDFFRQLGGFSPTLGVIGTVLGLIHMLANLEDAESMGPAIASAFIATMYGVSSANLLYLPLGNKLKTAAAQDALTKRIIIEGVISIQSGASPRSTEDRLRALFGGKRGSETAPKAA